MDSPPLTRRDFIQASAATGAVLAFASRLSAAPETAPGRSSRPDMKAHRNLYNGDCNFFFYNPEMWQPEGGPYRAEAIHRYVDLLAQSGVDTLLINPNTQVTWYPSKQVEYVLAGYRRGDRAYARRVAAGNAALTPVQAERYVDHLVHLFDLYLDLTDAGVDWLAEAARACRQRGVRPWLSYRMNATHFSGAPDSPVNCRLFREPQNRLSGRIPGPQSVASATWLGLNYGSPSVRDYMFAMIREGVESYDYEGVELDWLRHPVCLEPTATSVQVAELTTWFAALKAMIRAKRPDCPLGLRIPANLGYLRDIGIDVKALVADGVVDFLTFSNFWQTPWEMPHDALRRELGPDVKIYGGMEDAPNWLEAHAPSLTTRPLDQELQLAGDHAFKSTAPADNSPRIRGTRYLTASAELMRGNAAGKLALGVDGLEQFNFYVTDQVRVPGQRADYAALNRLHDLEFLRGKEKHYAFNTASIQATKLWDVPEQLPVVIAPRHRRALRIPMCSEPAGARLHLVIQVVTAAGGGDCGVSFNGAWPKFSRTRTEKLLFPAGPYSRHVAEHEGWNYFFQVEAIHEGWNEITLYNESAGDLNILAVELGIAKVPPGFSPPA